MNYFAIWTGCEKNLQTHQFECTKDQIDIIKNPNKTKITWTQYSEKLNIMKRNEIENEINKIFKFVNNNESTEVS